MKDFFLQKYKGKENPLKDLVDFSIQFSLLLKFSRDRVVLFVRASVGSRSGLVCACEAGLQDLCL